MAWPASELEESVAHFRIKAPVFLRCNFLEFDCSIGYLPNRRLHNMPIEIQLGYGLMFVERSGLRFVLAHELAHARHLDIPWMLDEITLSPILRNLTRVRRSVGCLPRIHQYGAQEVDELRADRAAAEFCDPLPFARSLLTSAAAVEVYLNWLHTGTFQSQYFRASHDDRFLIEDAERRRSLDEAQLFKAILTAFKADDDFFQDCLATVVANDKPAYNYPSLANRLKNLGLNMIQVRATIDIKSSDLIQTDELLAWLPASKRVAN